MKVESKKIEGFKPLVITITIESELEFEAIKRMATKNISIPEIITGREHGEIVKNFLNKLNDNL